MKPRWIRSLALSLGILVMGPMGMAAWSARADEMPLPVIQPYPPVAAPEIGASPAPASPSPVEVAEVTPAATLDRPIALHEERKKEDDSQVQPTGLFSNRGVESVVVSPATTFPSARPMPAGSSSNLSLPMPAPLPSSSPPPPDVPYTWRQPPTSALTTQSGSPPSTVPMPSPSAGTGASAGVAPMPGNIASPGIMATPGVGTAPGEMAAPGVATGPMGAPLVDGYVCDGCCAPGCCASSCCDGMCCNGCGGWGNGCCGCCFGNRWWGSAEYLLWFIRGQRVPPLLTSGSVADNPPGAIGQPGTTVLLGNQNLANNPYSGVRLRGGFWLDDCHRWGFELGGFFLGGNNNTFTSSSMGVPFLARPFFNAQTGQEDIEAVATPNGLAGTFTAVNTFFLYGAEANLRRNLCCGCNWFLDGYVGWRLLGLNESLSMTENLAVTNSTNPNLPTGSTFLVNDRFGTSNLFNGAQVGLFGEYRVGRWFANVRNSIALGGTQQVVNISGSTISQGPGIPATTGQGGLLAQSSNIGTHTRSMVSWVEEIGFHVGYQFTPHIGAFVGYNFLYWSSVVRPAEQIDRVVNPNLIPPATGGGPSRPEFSFNGANFWVQGIDFGVRILW